MHQIAHDILVPGIPILEKILRPLIVYVFLAVVIRVAGKRELGALTPLDLVVAFTLSNAVQNAIIGDDNSVTGGIIGGTVLLVVNYAFHRFLYNHKRLDRLIEGQPDVLILNGRLIRENLERELITEDQLLAVCHEQGVERFEDVQKAILETSGTISVFAHHPTPDEESVAEIIHRLDGIEALLRRLQPASPDGMAVTATS
jgi:uncharacterized membrane protein YcaP (DUF421 family)